MAKELKETYRLPLVVLSAAVAAKKQGFRFQIQFLDEKRTNSKPESKYLMNHHSPGKHPDNVKL